MNRLNISFCILESDSVFRFLEVEIELEDTFGEDGFKSRFLGEVPLFP